MDPTWLTGYDEACDLALQAVGDEAVAAGWAEPSALQGLTVGGLATHLYTAIRRFEKALDEELPTSADVISLAAFYGLNRVDDPGGVDAGWHPLLRDDAEQRAEAGPERVTERFRAVVDRLRARLLTESPDRLVPIWTVADGVTPLRVYVTTRVVELVVHSDDLAVSVGREPVVVPPAAASMVVGAFVELARHRIGDLNVIRAFARQERAEEGALRVL